MADDGGSGSGRGQGQGPQATTGEGEGEGDVSGLMNVGRFLESFAALPPTPHFPLLPHVPHQCRIDEEVKTAIEFFSDPLVIHLENMRDQKAGKRRRVEKSTKDQAEDGDDHTSDQSPARSPEPVQANPPPDAPDARGFQEQIQEFERILATSKLQTLKEAEKKVRPKKGSKPMEANCLGSESVLPLEDQLPDIPISTPEVVLSVGFYRPGRMTKVQEYLVLGSQKLTALRDKFQCLSDLMLDGPQIKSGYFFIENVFYNDMRSPTAIDYSQNVIDWVLENRRYTHQAFGAFTQADMDSVHFKDLSIRLNYPYYYVHQGNCEHVVMFKEIRILHASDNQNEACYPLQIFQSRTKRRKCRVCEIFPAKFATLGDRLASDNPCFFCERCYERLHYDSKGNLLYEDYEVYDYFQDH